MRHHDDCETCGRQFETMYCVNDTIFCKACLDDFGTDRWKGLGSRMATPEPCPAPKEEP